MNATSTHARSTVNLRPYMNLGDFRRITQCLPDDAVLQLSTIESDPEGTDNDWRFTRDVATLTVNHYPNGIVEVIVTDTRGPSVTGLDKL